MNILQAMQDEKLFGRFFRRKLFRGDTWGPWRAFLAALFGLPMDEAQQAIYWKHTQRTDIPTSQFNEAFLICGRRSGKSVISAMIAVYLACFVDYSEFCVAGEQLILPVICPDRRQAQTIMGYIRGMFRTSKVLASMVSRELQESIELNNGVKIEVATASFRTTRGFTCIAAILDEIAFLRSDQSTNPADEIVAALLPGMSTIPGALLLGISSPYARRGLLYERHQQYYGKSDARVLVWQADTRSMNPTVSRLTIEAALLRDRATASAEYLGEFRSDLEAFLNLELIESRVVKQRFELPYNSAVSYSAFADPSGGVSDSFALAIAHVDENGVGILDCVRESKAPLSPEAVCVEFAETLKRYHISEVTGDAYSAQWVKEAFGRNGVSYRISEQTRSQLYLELLPSMTSGQLQLLDHTGLVMQLSQLERRTGRGKDQIDHPAGSHDDVANACAGALVIAMAGEGATSGLVRVFEKIRDGTFDPFLPRPVVVKPPVKHVPGHSKPAAPPAAECPTCGFRTSIRVGSEGAPFRCPQDGTQFFSGGAVVTLPAGGCHCIVPRLEARRPIPGGRWKCDDCGFESDATDSGRWPTNGLSRAAYDRGDWRRRRA